MRKKGAQSRTKPAQGEHRRRDAGREKTASGTRAKAPERVGEPQCTGAEPMAGEASARGAAGKESQTRGATRRRSQGENKEGSSHERGWEEMNADESKTRSQGIMWGECREPTL